MDPNLSYELYKLIINYKYYKYRLYVKIITIRSSCTNTVLLILSKGLQFQDATNLGNAKVSSLCVLYVVYFLAQLLNDETPGM